MKVIIHIDGGSRGNPGFGASAYVIKDNSGRLLASEGRFLGVCTNNYAEFTALLIALEAAKKIKAAEIQIYSDSQLLVRQYLGQYKIKNPTLVEIMQSIRQAAKGFKTILIDHVPREKNKEADKLANIAMDNAIKPTIKKFQAEAAAHMRPAREVKIINHLAAPAERVKKAPAETKKAPLKPAAKVKETARKTQGSEQLELF